jgi:predicted  nucleic acid-binding Zn-ribbon protein
MIKKSKGANEMTYNEQIKSLTSQIKTAKADRKDYAKGLTRSDEKIRKNAEELVAMQDELIAKLTAKRGSIANAATRGIFA